MPLVFHINRSAQEVFIRPGLIHRLDKETSGLIVAAKTPRAHSRLSRHFERRHVKKRYLALVVGFVSDDEGTITGNIGRFPDEKCWGLKSDGRPSETKYWVRERSSTSTLLELEPVTGRTNQLRIHSRRTWPSDNRRRRTRRRPFRQALSARTQTSLPPSG